MRSLRQKGACYVTRLVAAGRADHNEKKDHRGRHANDDNQCDTDALPVGFREPTARPLLYRPIAFWTCQCLAADVVSTARNGEKQRPLSKLLHQPNDSPAWKGGNVNGPLVYVTVHVQLRPGRWPIRRREGMAAPRTSDGFRPV
jgi:hypothetical protein